MTTTPREFGLNKPTPFDGDRKKITTFIQEVKIYLMVNKHVYTTDESMVAFVLSYMMEKEAVQWRELYVEQMTDMNGDLVFSTFKKCAEELVEAFKPADRTTEAMNRLMVLKQGDRTAEELVMEFRLLAAQAGLGMKSSSDHIHMIGLFRKTLHPQTKSCSEKMYQRQSKDGLPKQFNLTPTIEWPRSLPNRIDLRIPGRRMRDG